MSREKLPLYMGGVAAPIPFAIRNVESEGTDGGQPPT